jgi:hypothetical protein
MSNVIKLFQYGAIDDDRLAFTASVTVKGDILAMCGQMAGAVKKLSECLDAIDDVIDGFGDEQARNRQELLMKMHRKSLIDAMLELSREVRRLPQLQIKCAG